MLLCQHILNNKVQFLLPVRMQPVHDSRKTTPPVIFCSAKFDSGVPASLCLVLGRFCVLLWEHPSTPDLILVTCLDEKMDLPITSNI